MPGVVFLDRQHAGKPDRADYGAGFDFDRSGKIEVWEMEASVTPWYLLAAERNLVERGHRVICLSDGYYSERHTRVAGYCRTAKGPCVYVAAHLNAGGGKYGSVFYDLRSKLGEGLAKLVALSLGTVCPELSDVRTVPAAANSTATGRAYNTISGIFPTRAVALCFEPFFLDSPAHAALAQPEGLARVGRALAEGVDAWIKSQEKAG